MAIDGAEVAGIAIKTNIRILAGFPPARVRAIIAAIAIGRTGAQVRAFIERYKGVASEAALYEAIIAETLKPLGIPWPPPTK